MEVIMALLKDDVMVGFVELFSIHKFVLEISLRVFFYTKIFKLFSSPGFSI